MVFDLSGKVALVTGAGQSVGAGIARMLAAQGAAVAVNDVVADRAEAMAKEVGGTPAPFDVTDYDGVVQGVREAEQRLGPVDILVNNAGNMGANQMVLSQFRDMDRELWPKFLAVNLYGVMHCTKAVLDSMCERGWGRVITISSGAGVTGIALGISAYGAGKGGALAFMRHLSQEVAQFGVTVNSLALGLMEMPGGPSDATAAMARRIPLGRLGRPADIGAACVWLASDEAAWVTGQTININGGSHTT
jgi:NAD(P)-dependent dehydrogenase (short-subunit alcohol dehydrogenase family)